MEVRHGTPASPDPSQPVGAPAPLCTCQSHTLTCLHLRATELRSFGCRSVFCIIPTGRRQKDNTQASDLLPAFCFAFLRLLSCGAASEAAALRLRSALIKARCLHNGKNAKTKCLDRRHQGGESEDGLPVGSSAGPSSLTQQEVNQCPQLCNCVRK